MTWEARDRYEGQPFVAGGQTFTLDPESPTPLAVQLAQRLTFPITEQGTYWVRVRLAWSQAGTRPDRLTEAEYRLDIFRGKPPVARTPLPAAQPIPNCFIRVAPSRTALTYGEAEPLLVPVVFTSPGDQAPAPRCQVVVTTPNLKREVKRVDVTPAWRDGQPATVTADPGGLAGRRVPGGGHLVLRGDAA